MERPIILKPEESIAILEGRKTQTRRIMKEQSDSHGPRMVNIGWEWMGRKYRCPFGNIGDILWVKETYLCWGRWKWNRDEGKRSFKDLTSKKHPVRYLTLTHADKYGLGDFTNGIGYHKRPSLFMPQSASRLRLRVRNVWVERLQDITEDGAIAEGATFLDLGLNQYGMSNNGWSMRYPYPTDPGCCLGSARMAFANYVNALYGGKNWNLKDKETWLWNQNPWAWACEYEVAKEE